MRYPVTPDGRYFVVRGRLWRCSDPSVSPERRKELTRAFMSAWRGKGHAVRAGDAKGREEARQRIENTKQALSERGTVWWKDVHPTGTGIWPKIRRMWIGLPDCGQATSRRSDREIRRPC